MMKTTIARVSPHWRGTTNASPLRKEDAIKSRVSLANPLNLGELESRYNHIDLKGLFKLSRAWLF